MEADEEYGEDRCELLKLETMKWMQHYIFLIKYIIIMPKLLQLNTVIVVFCCRSSAIPFFPLLFSWHEGF